MYEMGISLLLSLVMMCGSGGNVSQTEIIPWESSALYTDAEILDAIAVTEDYFAKEFQGCTLREISYMGDDHQDEFVKWAKDYEAEEAIVLVSTFDVDVSGGDGSLNPNDTYEDWEWVLVRDNGAWRHVTHGYC